MTSIVGKVHEDIEDYVKLCERFQEEPEKKADGSIDCYVAHAKYLESKLAFEQATQKQRRQRRNWAASSEIRSMKENPPCSTPPKKKRNA